MCNLKYEYILNYIIENIYFILFFGRIKLEMQKEITLITLAEHHSYMNHDFSKIFEILFIYLYIYIFNYNYTLFILSLYYGK